MAETGALAYGQGLHDTWTCRGPSQTTWGLKSNIGYTRILQSDTMVLRSTITLP
jgi:hypothetical protein